MGKLTAGHLRVVGATSERVTSSGVIVVGDSMSQGTTEMNLIHIPSVHLHVKQRGLAKIPNLCSQLSVLLPPPILPRTIAQEHLRLEYLTWLTVIILGRQGDYT